MDCVFSQTSAHSQPGANSTMRKSPKRQFISCNNNYNHNQRHYSFNRVLGRLRALIKTSICHWSGQCAQHCEQHPGQFSALQPQDKAGCWRSTSQRLHILFTQIILLSKTSLWMSIFIIIIIIIITITFTILNTAFFYQQHFWNELIFLLLACIVIFVVCFFILFLFCLSGCVVWAHCSSDQCAHQLEFKQCTSRRPPVGGGTWVNREANVEEEKAEVYSF